MVHITILGAGPAGLAAAWRLARQKEIDAKITLLEKENSVGGLARSFEHQGLYFDFGSHRLHPSCSPEILKDIKDILAGDCLFRPRNGRILLRGRFIRFPLRPLDLIQSAQTSFLAGMARDMILSSRKAPDLMEKHFHDALIQRAGKTLSHAFYFPYAKKIWGLEPKQISSKQAQVRVDAFSFHNLLRKLLPLTSKNNPSQRTFYYPRNGIGQITNRIAEALKHSGVDIRLNTTVHQIRHENDRVLETFMVGGKKGEKSIPTDLLLSTIPVSNTLELLHPEYHQDKRGEKETLRFRSLVLLYAIFSENQLTPFDAHYFPEAAFVFSRVSEPKNYSGRRDPPGLTGICMEFPCDPEEDIIGITAERLWQRAKKDPSAAGFNLPSEPIDLLKKVVGNAYPVYKLGFETTLRKNINLLHKLDNIASFGRCGLFVHDNLHHAMAMGYAAADCVQSDGRWDRTKWADAMKTFETFTVED